MSTKLSDRLSSLCKQMSGGQLPVMMKSTDRTQYAREFATLAEAARCLESGRPIPAGLLDAELPPRPAQIFVE